LQQGQGSDVRGRRVRDDRVDANWQGGLAWRCDQNAHAKLAECENERDYPRDQQPVPAVTIPDGAAQRLAGSLRIPTISSEDPAAFDAEAFRALHAYLHAAFPRVHAQLRREVVGTHSLLYTWQGSDSSLEPILLSGHLDVVPVETGTHHTWQEDPFGGRIIDGFIWGRGAIDNKSAVLGTLEAVEMLLDEGFQPLRTVFLAYGHDEEVGGTAGAREIAEILKARGIDLEMVLDEGGGIGDGVLPGISEPVALVGIAEKGFVTIELSTRVAGGHSSLPPRESAVGILGAAVPDWKTRRWPRDSTARRGNYLPGSVRASRRCGARCSRTCG
jgi:carboxypeptidase PM20D1